MKPSTIILAVIFALVFVFVMHYVGYIQEAHDAGIHDANIVSYVVEKWVGYPDPRRSTYP